jgi:tetratricopeptide (TPR) repeat protein
MSAEWLEKAVRAARDVPSAGAQEAARTRRNVLAALAGGSRWRTARALLQRRGSWLVLAVATVLFAGVCAAATGTPSRIAARLGLARRAANDEAAVVVRVATKPTILPSAPVVPSAPPAPPPELPSAAPAVTSTVPPARPVAIPGPDPQALYAQAHALHFHDRDPARALAAWDRYLAVASRDIRGGFVLEARYNRAICLVRLGQREEARQALQPFADGRWGAYRRDDAQALLDELGR